jgi:small subunit ribosomal protein S17
MAETPENETPENIVEEVETAADNAGEAGRGGERSETGGDNTGAEAAAETTEAPAAPAAPATTTRRERLEQRRSARRKSRGQTTPEERQAERQQRREHNAAERRRYRARTKAKDAELRSAQPAPEPIEAAPAATGRPKVRQGIVLSAKPNKTISVRIDIVRRHRRYGKILRTSTTLHAHDEANTANEGDTVRVVECRPMSRTKRWRLTEVLERAR